MKWAEFPGSRDSQAAAFALLTQPARIRIKAAPNFSKLCNRKEFDFPELIEFSVLLRVRVDNAKNLIWLIESI